MHGSSNREVSWPEHVRWFGETLAEQKRKVFIILQEQVPIGQVRFDRYDRCSCVVSIYLLRAFTGHGWGVHAIREGCKAIFDIWDVKEIIAYVRTDNPGGLSAFLKAGFQKAEQGVCPANHYSMVLRRSETRCVAIQDDRYSS